MQTTPRKFPWAQTSRNLQQFIPVPGYKTTLLPGLYVSEIPKTFPETYLYVYSVAGKFSAQSTKINKARLPSEKWK